MLIKQIKHIFDPEHLKEDLRKLGINLITAGTASLFVTHDEHPREKKSHHRKTKHKISHKHAH